MSNAVLVILKCLVNFKQFQNVQLIRYTSRILSLYFLNLERFLNL